jgi:glycosyltransferase involved in cell wall biosynthesis
MTGIPKVAFGMIVFNGDFVLRQCLEAAYPFASQILVAEGPVGYWQKQGFTTSTDRTNEILRSFPDPEKKITVVHGTYAEKDQQCNAYVQHIRPDADYVWNLDSDEMYKPEDIAAVATLLEQEHYTSVGFKSFCFFGGFDRCLGGFEERNQVYRIKKIYPGSKWLTHRPPTIVHAQGAKVWPEKHLDYEVLAARGIRMYHYSYVFPRQVRDKVGYYKAAVSRENCIDDYYNRLWLPWVRGDETVKQRIENEFNGVHEFLPLYRGDCRTYQFSGTHPMVIQRDLEQLKIEWEKQLEHLGA